LAICAKFEVFVRAAVTSIFAFAERTIIQFSTVSTITFEA